MLTLAYLEERAKRGNGAGFDRILARVPDVPPVPGDEIEGETSARTTNKRLRPSAGAKRNGGPKPKTRARRG